MAISSTTGDGEGNDEARPLFLPQPHQEAPLRILQLKIPDHTGFFQPAKQAAHPGSDGSFTTSPSATGDESNRTMRADPGLGPDKLFGAGRGFQNALAMEIKLRVRPPLRPV